MSDEIKRKPGRPKGSKGLKPKIQGHVMRAIKALEFEEKEGTGKNLTSLLIASFKEDVRATLTVVAKYLPKELHTTGSVKHDHEHGELNVVGLHDTFEQLHAAAEDTVRRLAEITPEKPMSH